MPVTIGIGENQVLFSFFITLVRPLIARSGLSLSLIVTDAVLPTRKFAGVTAVTLTLKSSSISSLVSWVVATSTLELFFPAGMVTVAPETAVKSSGDLAVPDTVSKVTVVSLLVTCDSSTLTRAMPPSSTTALLSEISPKSSSRMVSLKV